MGEVIEREWAGNIEIRLEIDHCASNPRTDHDPVGKVFFKESREYRFEGTETARSDFFYDELLDLLPDAMRRELEDFHIARVGDEDEAREDADFLSAIWDHLSKDHVLVALYYHSHGPQCSLNATDGYNAKADGIAYLTPAQIQEEWGGNMEDAKRYLLVELETYAAWLAGDVYGWVVEDHDTGEEDSCWGYYGETDYPMSEAREIAKAWHEAALEREAQAIMDTRPDLYHTGTEQEHMTYG